MNKKVVKEYLFITAGLLLVAVGIHVFKNPNKFATGGISGLSIVLAYFLPDLPIGTTMAAMNIFILLIGYLILGRDFGIKSLYGTFALSFFIWVMGIVVPLTEPLTNQKFLELIYCIIIPGIGSAIVFHYGASTGGTDIIAKILSKHFKFKISTSLLISDFIVALIAGLLFGAEVCLYSVLGVCLKSFFLDYFLESLRIHKIVVVISDENELIKDFICRILGRSATVHAASGAYTSEIREVITTVLNRKQTQRLQQYIKETDPHAFITISNTTEIIGNGFGSFE